MKAIVAGLIEAGSVTPLVGKTYTPIDVPEGVRYPAEGHARGKVVITIEATPMPATRIRGQAEPPGSAPRDGDGPLASPDQEQR
jgi:hypothetical protein